MCRICGRMVKCIFDSMPSRAPISSSKRAFSTAAHSPRTRSRTQHVSSRQLIQAAFNIDSHCATATPSFLLPQRSKLHEIATLQQEATPAPQFQNTQPLVPPNEQEEAASDDRIPAQPPTMRRILVYTPEKMDGKALARANHIPRSAVEAPSNESQDHAGAIQESSPGQSSSAVTSPPKTPAKPLVLSKSLQSLLPALHAQRPHYITAHIHRFPYLLTEGDTLRLPFHMHGVQPGDTLRFNRASLLGSRDYTLKAGGSRSESYDKKTNEPNYLDERLFECRVRVLGVDSQPMTIKEKKKRRNRRVRTVKSKHKYTVCKVMEVQVKSLDELKGGGDVLLLE